MSTPDQMMLREAAHSMRVTHPMSHPRHEMWGHMADLLEHEATSDHPDSLILNIARAYLSAVGRPDINEEL